MIADLQAENERLLKVLNTIAQMGSVCQDFEACRHASCRDSCSSALLALEALGSRPIEPCVFESAQQAGAAVALGIIGMAQAIKDRIDEEAMVAWETIVAEQHAEMGARMQEALEEDSVSWRFRRPS